MLFFEYGNEILIVDCGLQFPEEDTPGIDYIIPNTEYLEKRRNRIVGIIITHGHYDHIGAIPYLLGKLGNPTIYCDRLSKEIIAKRHAEFPTAPTPEFVPIKDGDRIRISPSFTANFFSVTHNIPEGVGMVLETPVGRIVHPGEFKFDYDRSGNPKGLETWKRIGQRGILTLLLDSTNAEVPGHSVSERVVEQQLEAVFRQCHGRIIVGTFASLLDRIYEIIKIAVRLERKIAVSGYSMQTNIEIARNLGLMKLPKNSIIPLRSINQYPDRRLMILSTGAQGEPNASLMRIANSEHKQIRIKQNDTVVFSSSVIPGNERPVQRLKDNLARQGATIYHSAHMDLHSTGHAPKEELKAVIRMIKPKFFIPIHGYYFMRFTNARNAEETGVSRPRIALPDNGHVVEIARGGIRVTGERVPTNSVLVDGLGVGDVREVVLRDRRVMADDGIFVIITVVDIQKGRVRGNPDIISRGFVYLRESGPLLQDARKRVKDIVEHATRTRPVSWPSVRDDIREDLGKFFFEKTERRPMVLPVIIEV